MKKIYTLFCATLFACIMNAQNPVPNSSFESWTGNAPTSWSNSFAPVTQVTPGHTGTYAVQVGSTGQLTAGSGNGFPVSQTYQYINFYYKFNKVASEYITISVELDDANSTTLQLVNKNDSTASSIFKAVSIPIPVIASGIPATCTIDMYLSGSAPGGSYFIIDDVSLSNSPLGVEEIQKQALTLQVFPNPAANTVHIRFDATGQKTSTVQLTDITGRVVKEITTSFTDLSMDISGIPAGNYIVVIKNDEMMQTKKLVIQ